MPPFRFSIFELLFSFILITFALIILFSYFMLLYFSLILPPLSDFRRRLVSPLR